MAEGEIIRDLGDGLILRRSRAADREAVAAFHANTLLDAGEEPPLERLSSWILDLMSGSRFRDGPRLRFQEGRITVEPWTPERIEAGDAAFPGLSFLPLLFGFRALDEIQHAFPDCSVATDEARALLPILFPKKDSHVWSGEETETARRQDGETARRRDGETARTRIPG